MKKIACVFALALALPAAAQLSLKEFTLGAPMSKCPAGTKERSLNGAILSCLLGPTTLANQPVDNVLISIFDGRVQTVMFNLPGGHRAAHREIFEALVQKFGPPSVSKPHVNSATWLIEGQTMQFDGWEGAVLIEDTPSRNRASKANASSNKSDL